MQIGGGIVVLLIVAIIATLLALVAIDQQRIDSLRGALATQIEQTDKVRSSADARYKDLFDNYTKLFGEAQGGGVTPSVPEPASIPGAVTTVQFMVKDSKKYAATGGWGFARFIDGKPADEAQHQTCYACHQARVKNHDLVFTRYAP